MIPSVLSSQVKKGVEDFLKTTFPVSTPFFHGVMDRFLGADGGVFKGPYLSIKLPHRTSSIGPDFFPGIPLFFPPYLHQEQAFRRLSGEQPASTIIATGPGSGKTECFLYPILDYCWRHRGERGVKAIIIYPMSRGTSFNNSVDMKGDRKIRKGLCGDQPALTLPGIGEFPGCSGQPFRNEPDWGWLCRTKERGHRS